MNNLVKFGLIGAALYFAYQHFAGSATAAPSAEASPTTPAPAFTVWDRILAWAQKQPGYDGLANTYQWNYAYNEIRGVQVPENALTSTWDWNKRITFDEWAARISGAGLSGIRRAWRA
jgi:hypothetical protein